MPEKVITRFAPSPTGPFHIGSARTALFNYAFAKKHGGTMILRIEDTDVRRSKKECEDDILAGLQWLGIEYGGPYRQSERSAIYKAHIQKLLESGAAYISEEKEGESKTIVRFRNPNKRVAFVDEVRGKIEFDTTELGDFAIARDETSPLYNLAVVIDDALMGVTHVIRGEDGISNTPRQILLLESLGFTLPKYAHIPLILASDRSKLSKRSAGTDVSVSSFKAAGYLPGAMLNFLALLGWSPQKQTAKGETLEEIFTPNEFFAAFSLAGIQKAGAVFGFDKLQWLNREHIKRMPTEELARTLEGFLPDELRHHIGKPVMKKVMPIILERINVFGDIKTMHEEGELGYFFERPEYDARGLLWKGAQAPDAARTHLEYILSLLSNITESDFSAEKLKDAMWEYATEHGRGDVLWPMRFALSGREKSPDPFVLADIFGKKEAVERIRIAIIKLNELKI